ncbi:hypothetical protein D3C59_20490 [Streptomyces sp. SHP22-7]|nr:hypothetical protein D3C59_20490 [Streptomyces sp. SHP22-7]
MWCAFLHADPGLSSASDRVSIPRMMEPSGPHAPLCAWPAVRRLGGAPGRTFGWCSPGGREDLPRPRR